VRTVHVEELGAGPRLLLVHGSVANARATWDAQLSLADRFRLVLVDRPGFPPNPSVERVDFEEHAELVADLIEPGTHVCGHSYGGVIALLAAARRPDAVRSLTVVEPPAFGVARGHAEVEAFVEWGARHWAQGPRDPEAFVRAFLDRVGAKQPEGPLDDALLQGARTLMVERSPWEAEIPFEALARAAFPKLVVSGAHDRAFDAVCDALEDGLGARRAVLPGRGHAVQRLGAPFNELLAAFVERAEPG
jgi:pimeloyl-ACP methyl ester carboxylesterase